MKDPKIGFPNDKFSLSNLTRGQGLDRDENNHQFLNFKYLLKWKKIMNRPKDQEDIKLITNIIKSSHTLDK